MSNPTPSKRSMERAKKLGPCLSPDRCNEVYNCPFHQQVALAFDRLREETIEECATVADDCKCMELTNDSCKCFGIAKTIRLKLKGGEDE